MRASDTRWVVLQESAKRTALCEFPPSGWTQESGNFELAEGWALSSTGEDAVLATITVGSDWHCGLRCLQTEHCSAVEFQVFTMRQP